MSAYHGRRFYVVVMCRKASQINDEEKMMMQEKNLGITEVEDAKAGVSDLQVYGDVDTFALLCKASSQAQGWMKSTKVANVPDGCIVQVTTQQKNPDGSYALAEALTFVPGVNIDDTVEPRRFIDVRRSGGLLGGFNPYEESPLRKIGEYLQYLYEAQKSGHDVHKEIDEALKKFRETAGL